MDEVFGNIIRVIFNLWLFKFEMTFIKNLGSDQPRSGDLEYALGPKPWGHSSAPPNEGATAPKNDKCRPPAFSSKTRS